MQEILERPRWKSFIEFRKKFPLHSSKFFNFSNTNIEISTNGIIPELELKQLVMLLHPWRKGPFKLGELLIDAEWRSNLKFDRFFKYLPPLNEKKILDIGSGNSYYLYRIIGELNKRMERANRIVGIEPSEIPVMQSWFINSFLETPVFEQIPVRFENWTDPATFDLILCMGVIYHIKSPFEFIDRLIERLNPGGTLILESQTIPGFENYWLTPNDRYAKARNIYFVPMLNALTALLERKGLSEIKVVDDSLVTPEEQRKTEFMHFESLTDFLDPNDQTKTIEGYPAPRRVVVISRKKS